MALFFGMFPYMLKPFQEKGKIALDMLKRS